MLKKLRKDKHGDLSFFTVFVILAINMLMAFLLLFASIRIECINIRNAAKMELNNVSARIYATAGVPGSGCFRNGLYRHQCLI